MTLDPAIVHRRLRLIRELLGQLGELGEWDTDRFEHEPVSRLAMERIVTQLVELAVSINSHVVSAEGATVPSTYRETFRAAADAGLITPELAAELAPSAGLRNVLIHAYLDIDLDLLAAAVPAMRKAYSHYAAEVGRYLLEKS